jgi:hypothetical protein
MSAWRVSGRIEESQLKDLIHNSILHQPTAKSSQLSCHGEHMRNEIRLAISSLGGQKQLALLMQIGEDELSRILNGERGLKIDKLEEFLGILKLKIVPITDDLNEKLITMLCKKCAELEGQVEEMRKNGGQK